MTETWTLEEQRAHRKLWVEALRSGKYEQVESKLTNGEGYCCLGVACLVAGKSNDNIMHDVNLTNFPEVKSFFGLRDNHGDYRENCLVDLNDDGTSFSDIADIIEREPPGLFTDATSEAR
jgi:hypothetical protein